MHNKSVAAKSHYAFKSNFWGSPQSVDCYIVIKDFSEEQLNNMRIRKESDNAVVHIGTLKTSNMKGMMLKDK